MALDWNKFKHEFETKSKYGNILSSSERCDRCGTNMVIQRANYHCPNCGLTKLGTE